MILKKTNNSSLRLNNLDFLRGFFVVLALLEHYNYYLNKWYVDYFKEFSAVKTTYSVHYQMLGKVIPSDSITNTIALIFIPWVSQVYLALATFNIAKESQDSLRNRLNDKLKTLLILLFVFYLENFLVAQDFGQAISFNPIMLWMIILGLINIFYAKFGVRGVFFLTMLSLLRWNIPIQSLSVGIEEFVQSQVHPSFEYDARIEYFLSSGCLGFFLGYMYYHWNNHFEKKALLTIIISSVFILTYFVFTTGYEVDPTDPYRFEHVCSQTPLGTLFLLGAQALVITSFVLLETKGVIIRNKFFTWVGINSLLVFLLHKILFLKVIMPISLFFHSMIGKTITDTILDTSIYILAVLFLCWMIQKLQLGSIINGNSRKD